MLLPVGELALTLSLSFRRPRIQGSKDPRIFDSFIHSAKLYCYLFCSRLCARPCAGCRGQREESDTVLTFREFRI